jgi:two-component system, chemotaxis family, chemotaxis protein CheY
MPRVFLAASIHVALIASGVEYALRRILSVQIEPMALILVIDDIAQMRDLVRRMLERAKHTVIEAEDGERGLAVFAAQDPAVVITDLLMPKKEGIETIQQIRRLRPDAKIIAMSGSDDVRGKSLYLDAAKRLGADAVLAKPFQAAALAAVVDRLLNAS